MSVLGRRHLAVIVLGVLVALAAALPAHAHDRTTAPLTSGVADEATRPIADDRTAPVLADQSVVLAAGGADSPVGLVLIVAAALTLLVTVQRVPRSRRVVAIVLVAILAGVAFETGVHSVHHLGDPKAAGHCVVALSADHVVPVAAAACDLAPTEAHRASSLDRSASPTTTGDYRPDAGRAPPSSTA